LSGHFFQDFLSQFDRRVIAVLVRYELDDVSFHPLALRIDQRDLICVQRLHVGKVGIAHPHDNDAERQRGACDDLVDGVTHVVNFPICEYQEDEVVLVDLSDLGLHCLLHHSLQDGPEQGGPRQFPGHQCLAVGCQHSLHAVDLRVIRVPIQREAVGGLSLVLPPEPIHGN